MVENNESLAFAQGAEGSKDVINQWTAFYRSFLRNPDATAVIAMHRSAVYMLEAASPSAALNGLSTNSPYLQWSYKQLGTAVVRLVEALRDQGVKAGDVLATMMLNSVESTIFLLASSKLSTKLVPLDPQLLQQKDVLLDILKLLPLKVMLMDTVSNTRAFDEIISGSEFSPIRLVCDGLRDSPDGLPAQITAGWTSMTTFITPHSSVSLGEGGQSAESTDASPETIVDVFFTSGTTSRPKGCVHTVSSRFAETTALLQVRQVRVLPRHVMHTANFRPISVILTNVSFYTGGSIVYPSPAFNPEMTLRAIIDAGATYLLLIPTFIHALARRPEIDEIKPGQINQAIITGDIVSADLIAKCSQTLKATYTYATLGTTEGSAQLGWSDGVPSPIPATEGGIVALGRATRGSLVRVCIEGTHQPVRRGEKGFLHLGGGTLIKSYLENRDSESFYEDEKGGWFITGDVAFMDHDGVVYVLGRTKDVIKRKGVSISPAVIEGCINEVSGIESSVFGTPHAEYGEVPVAVVKATAATEVGNQHLKASLKERVLQKLGNDQELSEVYTLSDLELSEFPLNSTGKIMKRELRKTIEKKIQVAS